MFISYLIFMVFLPFLNKDIKSNSFSMIKAKRFSFLLVLMIPSKQLFMPLNMFKLHQLTKSSVNLWKYTSAYFLCCCAHVTRLKELYKRQHSSFHIYPELQGTLILQYAFRPCIFMLWCWFSQYVEVLEISWMALLRLNN